MKKSLIVAAALLVAVVIGVNTHRAGAQQQRFYTTPSAVVILGTRTTYAYFTNFNGNVIYDDSGQLVQYAMVSSNAPQGIVAGMNAADAMAIAIDAGLELIHSAPDDAFYIFARKSGR